MAKGKGKGFSAGPGGRDGGGQAGPLRGMIVKLTKTDMQNSTKKALLQIIRQAIDIAPSLPKLAELLQATLGHKFGRGWNVVVGTALTMHARYLKRSYASFVCSKPLPESSAADKAAAKEGVKASGSKSGPAKAAVYNILVFKAAEDTVGSLAGDSMAAVAAHFDAQSPYAFAERPRVVDDSPAPASAKADKKKNKAPPRSTAAGSTPAAPKLAPSPKPDASAPTDATAASASASGSGSGSDAVRGIPLRALRASVLTASEALRLGRFPDAEFAKVEAACAPIRGDMATSMRATVQRLVAVTRCLSLDQDPQSVAGGVKELLTRLYGSTWHVLSGTADAHAGVAPHQAPKAGSPYYVGGVSGAVTAAPGELLVLRAGPTSARRAEETWAQDRAMRDAAWTEEQPWNATSAKGVQGGSGADTEDLPVPEQLSRVEMAQNEVLYVFRPVPPSKTDVQAVTAGNSWGIGRAVVTALAFACIVMFCAVHTLADTRCSAENTFVGVNSRFGYEVYVPEENGGYVGGEWFDGWHPGAEMVKPVKGGSSDPDKSFEALEVGEDGTVLPVGGSADTAVTDAAEDVEGVSQGGEGGGPEAPAYQERVQATRAVVTCRSGAVRSATGWTRLGRYCLLFAGGLFMIGPVMRAMGKKG